MATDYVFDVSRLRGLGLIPSLEVPTEPVGLGREPETPSPVAEPVGVGQEPEGVGQVFPAEPSTYSGGASSLIPIPAATAVKGQWIEVFPTDPSGQYGIASQLQSDISNALPTIAAALASPAALNKYVYFGLSDPHSGAAQTPGEPPGMAILRAKTAPDGIHVGLCISPATAVPVPTSGPSPSPAPAPGAGSGGGMISNAPPTITWLQSSWVVGGTPKHAPKGLPPGVSTAALGVVGTWVWRPGTRKFGGVALSNFWCWYPPARVVTLMNGTYVYADPGAVTGDWTSLPAPTSPPVAGMTGTWQQAHEAYWVFVPGTGTAITPPAATDYTWLWWVLGIGAVGGVAYLIFE